MGSVPKTPRQPESKPTNQYTQALTTSIDVAAITAAMNAAQEAAAGSEGTGESASDWVATADTGTVSIDDAFPLDPATLAPHEPSHSAAAAEPANTVGTATAELTGAIMLDRSAKLSWRKRAKNIVTADNAPTWSLDLRAIADGVAEARARSVIDLSMRIAEALLSTGASAAEVTASVLRITSVYGLRSVHVDVTFTSIAVCHYRGKDTPITVMRTVRVRAADYERLARLQRLVNDIEDDPELSLNAARARLDSIARMPHAYKRYLVTAASALLGLSVCILLDGSVTEVTIATLNAIIVDRTQLFLARRKLPAFFAQMVGGMIPTLVAIALIWARARAVPGLEEVSPSAVVATGIVMLLAGLSVVGAAQDAIDGYYVTAGARGFEVIVLTLGIIVGVLTVLTVSHVLGAPMYLAPYSALTGNFSVQLVASGLIALAFALTSYAGPRTALVSIVTGTLGWVVYSVLASAGFGAPSASGVAALGVGVAAQVLARVFAVPSLALSTAGIVPLLPGLAVYRGLYQLATSGAGDYAAAFDALGGAMAIGLALAAGVSLGGYLGRAAQRDAGRIRDRARARALSRSHVHVQE